MRYVVNGLAVKRMLVGITYPSTKMTLVNTVILSITNYIYGTVYCIDMLQQQNVKMGYCKCNTCMNELRATIRMYVNQGVAA